MRKKTLEALKESIAHWRRMATGTEKTINEVPDTDNCALCGLFYAKGCRSCPVVMESGTALCYNTPYGDAYDAFQSFAHATPKKMVEAEKAFRSASAKQLAFLESLLPPAKRKTK